jgi:hypothetical protein
VEIVIDNATDACPGRGLGTAGTAAEFSEVRVARTIHRDGETGYEINGEPVRALDVQELLSDTGLGRELHTIVGQGQLDEILNAKPEERRRYIEEAAGILKHRRRRERALRKLEQVDGHIDKLRTVLRELRRQLRPLERQAEAADRYQALQAELRDVRVRLAAAELDRLTRLAADQGRDDAPTASEREVEARLRHARERDAHAGGRAHPRRTRGRAGPVDLLPADVAGGAAQGHERPDRAKRRPPRRVRGGAARGSAAGRAPGAGRTGSTASATDGAPSATSSAWDSRRPAWPGARPSRYGVRTRSNGRPSVAAVPSSVNASCAGRARCRPCVGRSPPRRPRSAGSPPPSRRSTPGSVPPSRRWRGPGGDPDARRQRGGADDDPRGGGGGVAEHRARVEELRASARDLEARAGVAPLARARPCGRRWRRSTGAPRRCWPRTWTASSGPSPHTSGSRAGRTRPWPRRSGRSARPSSSRRPGTRATRSPGCDGPGRRGRRPHRPRRRPAGGRARPATRARLVDAGRRAGR